MAESLFIKLNWIIRESFVTAAPLANASKYSYGETVIYLNDFIQTSIYSQYIL